MWKSGTQQNQSQTTLVGPPVEVKDTFLLALVKFFRKGFVNEP